MNNKKIKTSLTLNPIILEKVDEYRAKLRPIPSKTKAIENLILLGLGLQITEKLSGKTQPITVQTSSKKTLDQVQQLKDILSKPL